jgi:group I intron endonuclease
MEKLQRRKSGIYQIVNKINGKVYIGSAKHFGDRWYKHKWSLRRNEHENKHLQNAWNKYGKNNFEFVILEECSADERFDLEQKYLDIAQKTPLKYYNISYEVGQVVSLSYKLSDEEDDVLFRYWLDNGWKKTVEFVDKHYGYSDSWVTKKIREYKQITTNRPVHYQKTKVSDQQNHEVISFWKKHGTMKTYDYCQSKFGWCATIARRIIREYKTETNTPQWRVAPKLNKTNSLSATT